MADAAPAPAEVIVEAEESVSELSIYLPHLIVFFTSACLMAMEVLAGRVIARQTGNSIYTWTSVIGVILAGITIGNFIGGRLADRFRPRAFLGWLFFFASFFCLFTMLLNYYFWMNQPLKGTAWPTQVFLTVLGIFFMPALLLGSFGPPATKMALSRGGNVGATLGSVSAWGTIGCITGTLLAGFLLIGLVGSKGLTLLVALGLALAGLLAGPSRWFHAVWCGLVIGALALTRAHPEKPFPYQQVFQEPENERFNRDSQYQYVRVYDGSSGREPGRDLRVLALDYLIHGYVDVNDPSWLEYDYELVYAEVARRFMKGKKTVAAFFIGGGSFTFPRWVLHEWPASPVTVAEIDPLVVEANHAALGLPRDTPIRVMTLDARNAVDDLPEAERFDLVFGDAFNDLSVPFHLTTLEFSRKIKGHLNPGGVYMVNVIDDFEHGLFIGSVTNTLRQAFKHVYVFCTEREGIKNSRDTFVVAASDAEIETSDWQPRHGGEFCGSELTPDNLRHLQIKCRGQILTDDDAPVENLLAPMLRTRTR